MEETHNRLTIARDGLMILCKISHCKNSGVETLTLFSNSKWISRYSHVLHNNDASVENRMPTWCWPRDITAQWSWSFLQFVWSILKEGCMMHCSQLSLTWSNSWLSQVAPKKFMENAQNEENCVWISQQFYISKRLLLSSFPQIFQGTLTFQNFSTPFPITLFPIFDVIITYFLFSLFIFVET